MNAVYLAGAAMLLANPAAAQQQGTVSPQDAVLVRNVSADPQVISAIVRADGYDATIDRNGATGEPFISSDGAGNSFTIFFNNCTAGKDCRTIQFYAGFSTATPRPLSLINQWNRQKRFAKAYIDDQDDPRLEMDLNLNKGGVARDNFVNDFRLWVRLLDAFKTHISWGKEQ